MNGKRVNLLSLRGTVQALFEHHGVPSAESLIVADNLVMADAYGIHSHGIMRLSFYLPKLRLGTLNAKAEHTVLSDSGALIAWDALNSIGQVVAHNAMKTAMARAKNLGLAAVSVRHANHFGVAQYFSRLASEEDLVGIALSNASPAMPAFGGRTKLVGNNPWSVSAASAGENPIVIDMATTKVARGKILLAQVEGRSIPLDWAIDRHGEPTSDPAAALAGAVLPMAEHKGYAMSVAIDILTGLLTGGGTLNDVKYPGKPDEIGAVSQLFIALDTSVVNPNFQADVAAYQNKLRAQPPQRPDVPVMVPGDIEANHLTDSSSEGVAVPYEVIQILRRYCVEASVSMPDLDSKA